MMSKLEIALVVFLVMSFLLLFMNVPLGELILVQISSTLSVLCLLMAISERGNKILSKFKVEVPEFENNNPMIIRLSFISLSVLLLGIQFMCMFWPGGAVMLHFGLVLASIMLLLLLIQNMKSKKGNLKLLISRLIVCGVLALWLILSPMTLIESRYSEHPEFIKAYENHLKDPSNEEFRIKLIEEREKIGQ